VPADTATCIGIDLDPNQSTLYYATGGRAVRTVSVSGIDEISAPKDVPATPTPSPFTTLPGSNYAACGLRLLAPPDLRETTPAPALDLRRLVIADGRDVKLVTSRPGQTPVVVSYDAGNGNKNWIDVALDPNVEDFWAVDAASWHLAKFRRGVVPTTVLVEDLPGQPRGIAINGELRAAQTVGLVTVTTTSESIVPFWPQNTATRFAWVGQGTTAGASFAIQAFEVTYDAATGGTPDVNTGLCDPSLNIRCRLRVDLLTGGQINFSDATPKIISRGRSVVIREIVRSIPVVTSDVFRIGIAYIDLTSTSGGSACVPGTVAPASTLLRDPWPHAVFDFDAGLAVFGGDDTVYTKTTRNDNIVVNRTKPAVKYNLRIVNPDPGTSFKVGSSLPVSVEVRDPSSNCIDVSNLNDSLVLTLTDVTTHPGVPVGDSEGIYGTPLSGTGGGWAKTASLYRINLTTDSLIPNHTYRLCVGAPASTTVDGAADQVFDAPLAAEQCRDVKAKR
jgi:hypothetical protein